MKNVVLLFPGQGSQYVGMGSNIDSSLLDKANEVLGYDLKKMMTDGPEEDLTLTQNTQPAILTHSVGLFRKLEDILKEHNVEISAVMGHSVGEYAALVAAGALSFEDALKAVNNRGKFMQEAVPAGMGKMYAILKVPGDVVEKACLEASTEDNKVMPANFNDPDQIVISGHAEACDRAVQWLSENHADPHRAVELKVSAPFHSSLMQPARENMTTFFGGINFTNTKIPYIANIDAKKYDVGTDGNIVKENLIKQIDGAVLWTQSFSSLPDNTLCIEVGPGRVLMGLARKINRTNKVISLDKEGAFEELVEALK